MLLVVIVRHKLWNWGVFSGPPQKVKTQKVKASVLISTNKSVHKSILICTNPYLSAQNLYLTFWVIWPPGS